MFPISTIHASPLVPKMPVPIDISLHQPKRGLCLAACVGRPRLMSKTAHCRRRLICVLRLYDPMHCIEISVWPLHGLTELKPGCWCTLPPGLLRHLWSLSAPTHLVPPAADNVSMCLSEHISNPGGPVRGDVLCAMLTHLAVSACCVPATIRRRPFGVQMACIPFSPSALVVCSSLESPAHNRAECLLSMHDRTIYLRPAGGMIVAWPAASEQYLLSWCFAHPLGGRMPFARIRLPA